MLEAIYAWRRNGGMRWPSYERSDAIMDLRAASRNSNSLQPERPSLSYQRLHTVTIAGSFVAVPQTPYHLHTPCPILSPLPTLAPDLAQSREHRGARENRSPFARKKRVASIIWSDALYNVRHLSSEGRYLFHGLSIFPPGVTGTPLAPSRTGAQRGSADYRVCGTVTGRTMSAPDTQA